MKTVRIFFTKQNRMKFISHLDMTRFMSRLITKSQIPVWYTEGFNQHIYMNYALPLSLGFEGMYEILEIRLNDDEYCKEACLEALKRVSPPDIEFVRVAEPKMPMKDIAFAEFVLDFGDNISAIKEKLTEFLSRDSIICEKKGKKGKIKEIDIIPKIASFSFQNDKLVLCLTAGNEDNLNPSLVMDTFFAQCEIAPVYYTVSITMIYKRDGAEFK